MPLDIRSKDVASARRKRAGRLKEAHHVIPLAAFVSSDYHLVITSSGDLLAAWETEGIDSSCLSEDDLREHHRVLTLAINEADPKMAVHQYYIKDEARFKAGRDGYLDPVVTAIDKAREESLAGLKYHSTRIIYLFEWKTGFVVETNLLGKLSPIFKDMVKSLFEKAARESFRTRLGILFGGKRAAVEVPEKRLLEEIAGFGDAMDAFTARASTLRLVESVDSSIAEGIGPATLEFEKLTGTDAFNLFSRLYNWDAGTHENTFLPSPSYLAHWLANSDVDFGDPNYVWSGNTPLKMYTVRGFRDPVEFDVLRHLRNHPARMVIHTRFTQMGTEESSRLLASKIRSASNLGGFSKGDPQKAKRIEDLNSAMAESVRGRPFGRWNCTIALAGADLEDLQDQCRIFERTAAQTGIVLRREDMSKDFAFFTLFPGNHLFEFVTRTGQSSMAVAALMPYRLAEGRGIHPPKGSCFPESLCVLNAYTLENGMGAPVNFWINAQDLSHFAIFGGSGKGKSFTVNFLLTNWGRYAGVPNQPKGLRRWIIDRGHSYRSLCELLGGAYVNVGDPESRAAMNPFDLPPAALRGSVDRLVPFLGMLMAATSSAPVQLGEEDARALGNAILEMAKDMEDTKRRGSLQLLTCFLGGNPTLLSRLQSWVQGSGGIGGEFAHIFPDEPDGFGHEDVVVFNFSDEFTSPATVGPIFYYIISKIGAVIMDPKYRDENKLLFLDEAAIFLTPVKGDWKSELITATTRSFIRKAWKEWRKFGGGVGIATQEPRDLTTADPDFFESFRALVPTRILLNQPMTEALTSPEKGIGIAPHLSSALADLPKGVFLVDQRGMKRFLQLSVDATSYAIYSTDPIESSFRAAYLAAHPPQSHAGGVFGAYQAIGKVIKAANGSENKVAYLERERALLHPKTHAVGELVGVG